MIVLELCSAPRLLPRPSPRWATGVVATRSSTRRGRRRPCGRIRASDIAANNSSQR